MAMRVLGIVAAGGLALVAATSASGRTQAADHVTVSTSLVAVPVAAKPKKVPLCKKGQKSTKKKPCKKRRLQAAAVAGNAPVAGWKFGLTASQNDDGTWSFDLAYERMVAGATEEHTYAFQLAAGSASAAADLSTFTLSTGTQLGQFGAVTMSLAAPGGLQSATAPFGCTTGTWQMRTGKLNGMLRFAADGYFKTLVETSLPVTIFANTSGAPAACGGFPPPTCDRSSLLFGGDSTTPAGSFYVASRAGQLTLLRFFQQQVGPAKIAHFLSVTGLPASDLTVAADLSSATLTTTGAAPWFTGGLTFTAASPSSSFQNTQCGGTISFAQGAVTGDLTAHFAAVPAQGPPGGNAYVETS